MRRVAPFFLVVSSLVLPGCVAKTLYDVATLPVKVVSKGVDLATTSQSEADEKRGREIRKREEELGKLQREFEKLDEECRDGDRGACEDRDKVGLEIARMLPTVPVERED